MSENIYKNLMAQAEKLRRHTRQGSYKTRERYFEAYQRFLRFAAEKYRLQKISNVSGKHLTAYVEYMQEKGLSASTIKTDLSAIRFWHDQIQGAKYQLPSNGEYELERRSFGQVDRTWSMREFNLMISACWEADRPDYEGCLVLARYAGLRIHEALRIDTAIARNALNTGVLTIKGKGGKVREIPVNKSVRIELDNALTRVPPGQKLFVASNKQSHVAKTELQNFIARHREAVSGPDSRSITFHGLRHTCAAEWYKELTSKGMTDYQARVQVSKWLGHERDDVTRIYLASIQKEGERLV